MGGNTKVTGEGGGRGDGRLETSSGILGMNDEPRAVMSDAVFAITAEVSKCS